VEIVLQICYTSIGILEDTIRIPTPEKDKNKTINQRRDFFVIAMGMGDKGGKTKRKHFKFFLSFFPWFRYLTAVALASHRKYTSLTWSWHADSSRYFIVFPSRDFLQDAD
jgi:hypothetical protein